MPQPTWPWMAADQSALNPVLPPPPPARGLNVRLSTGPTGEPPKTTRRSAADLNIVQLLGHIGSMSCLHRLRSRLTVVQTSEITFT